MPLYAITNDMDADEFSAFTKATNYTAQILLAHFWMFNYVLEQHVLGSARPYALRRDIVLHWVERAAQRLPDSHKQYALWPLGMARCTNIVAM